MSLTARQQQVFDFLRDYAAREGMPPTQAEIASRFGFTQKAAGDHLRLIAAKGVIELRRDIPRGIRFASPPPRRREPRAHRALLPLVARLGTGPPALEPGEIEQWLPMAPELFRPRADYLRRARGASLPELGIHDGDLVGVHIAPAAGHGQVVVARVFARAQIELVVRRCLERGGQMLLCRAESGAGVDAPDGDAAAMEIEGLYCGHFHPHGE